jgi:hypothetical protein
LRNALRILSLGDTWPSRFELNAEARQWRSARLQSSTICLTTLSLVDFP